ncbi:MAG: SprB repeat-containing protein [Crocinitomicaceae bacterium]
MKPYLYLTAFFSLFTIFNAAGQSSEKPLDQDQKLTLRIVTITLPYCNGEDNGSATIEVEGGKEPYNYNWNTFPNQHEETAVNLSSGVYFVHVTDADGASGFKSVHIHDPNTSLLTRNKEVSIDEVELTASVSGSVSGSATYTYTLNDREVEQQKLIDLPVGVHKMTVKSNEGCVMVQYIQVFEVANRSHEKEIQSSVRYTDEQGKSLLISNLIPFVADDPELKDRQINLEKK